MNDVSRLSRAALEDTLAQIVDRLFLDLNLLDCPAELRDQDIYNPDKEVDIDDLDFIAALLRTAGLAPDRLGDEPASPPCATACPATTRGTGRNLSRGSRNRRKASHARPAEMHPDGPRQAAVLSAPD
jgi:hypothetical protein